MSMFPVGYAIGYSEGAAKGSYIIKSAAVQTEYAVYNPLGGLTFARTQQDVADILNQDPVFTGMFGGNISQQQVSTIFAGGTSKKLLDIIPVTAGIDTGIVAKTRDPVKRSAYDLRIFRKDPAAPSNFFFTLLDPPYQKTEGLQMGMPGLDYNNPPTIWNAQNNSRSQLRHPYSLI